ncbi:hypothetical protein EV360DRAFT_75048 [Lentinula raphanica]|nr:hypothetical protein EV360DRAFT_75048 [Lentinula raphanica]
MHLFSTRLLAKILFLLMIVNAIAAPIRTGEKHQMEDGALAETPMSKLAKIESDSESTRQSENFRLMTLVLRREKGVVVPDKKPKGVSKSMGSGRKLQPRGSERKEVQPVGRTKPITAGTFPVEPQEYWTVALLPPSDNLKKKTVPLGLRTLRGQTDSGHYEWIKDEKERSGYTSVSTNINLSRQYEVLGTVLLSLRGRQELTRLLRAEAALVNLLYINRQVRTLPDKLEEVKKILAQDGHVAEIDLKDSAWWNSKFYAPMLNKRGSGAGFVITKEEYPDEWELYVEAVKELMKGGNHYDLDWTLWAKDAGIPNQDWSRWAKDAGIPPLPVSPTLLAMDAALFPNGSASSLNADELNNATPYKLSEA